VASSNISGNQRQHGMIARQVKACQAIQENTISKISNSLQLLIEELIE